MSKRALALGRLSFWGVRTGGRSHVKSLCWPIGFCEVNEFKVKADELVRVASTARDDLSTILKINGREELVLKQDL